MIKLEADCREFNGKGQFIARINGRNSKFTFDREFIGRKVGRRGQTTEAEVDEPGLYELRKIEKKGDKVDIYKLVVQHNGELHLLRAQGDNLDGLEGKEAAMKIAKYLEDGCDFSDVIEVTEQGETTDGRPLLYYRILDKNQQKQADKARSVEQAEADCWAILQALPHKQAWEVTKKLRERLKEQNQPAEQTS